MTGRGIEVSLLTGVLTKSEIWNIWLCQTQKTPRSLAFLRAASHGLAVRGLGQHAVTSAATEIRADGLGWFRAVGG
jgi:hypothetical protein